MLTKAELPDCPVATAVQLIGNKWKLLILRNLLVRPWRFNEMLRSIPGISQKVLTDNLRALERDDLITRTVYPAWNMRSANWARRCARSSVHWRHGAAATRRSCGILRGSLEMP